MSLASFPLSHPPLSFLLHSLTPIYLSACVPLVTQGVTHDSVEDSRTALSLYRVYLELKSRDVFEAKLQDIYSEGRRCNWQVESVNPIDL